MPPAMYCSPRPVTGRPSRGRRRAVRRRNAARLVTARGQGLDGPSPPPQGERGSRLGVRDAGHGGRDAAFEAARAPESPGHRAALHKGIASRAAKRRAKHSGVSQRAVFWPLTITGGGETGPRSTGAACGGADTAGHPPRNNGAEETPPPPPLRLRATARTPRAHHPQRRPLDSVVIRPRILIRPDRILLHIQMPPIQRHDLVVLRAIRAP